MGRATRPLSSQDSVGRSINLLRSPDIFRVEELVRRGNQARIIDIVGRRDVEIPGISGEKVFVGENIWISDPGARSHETTLQVMTGSEVINSFSASASISGTYSALSVTSGANYSYESAVRRDSIYAFISNNTERYTVYLDWPGGIFNNLNKDFLRAVSSLPPWSDSKPPITSYESFFQKWGTHVIRKVIVGSRYQLKVQTDSVASADKESFGASVAVEYAGILGSKAGMKGEKVEERYKNSVQGEAVVIGGSEEKGKILAHSNNDENAFKEWAESRGTGENETITNIEVDTLGELLGQSDNEEHQKAGKHLELALQTLLHGPKSMPIRLQGFIFALAGSLSVSIEAWGASVSMHAKSVWGAELTQERSNQLTLHSHSESLSALYPMMGEITVEGVNQGEVTFANWSNSVVYMKLFRQGTEEPTTITMHEGGKKVVLPSLGAVGNYGGKKFWMQY